MRSAQSVAAVALVYKELWRMRQDSPQMLLDDLESCPGELSLLGMMGASAATPADWALVEALNAPAALPAFLAELDDPLRVEAALHAWPMDEPQPPGTCPEQYSGRRWQAVEAEMDNLRALGLSTTREDVEGVASSAWCRATGETHADYLDRWDVD